MTYLRPAGRSLVPPEKIQLKLQDGSIIERDFGAVFDLQDLIDVRGLPILEPRYTNHALQYHLEASSKVGSMAFQLLDHNPLDVRRVYHFDKLVERLETPLVAEKLVVTLTSWKLGIISHGEPLPEKLENIRLCLDIGAPLECDRMCRK